VKHTYVPLACAFSGACTHVVHKQRLGKTKPEEGGASHGAPGPMAVAYLRITGAAATKRGL